MRGVEHYRSLSLTELVYMFRDFDDAAGEELYRRLAQAIRSQRRMQRRVPIPGRPTLLEDGGEGSPDYGIFWQIRYDLCAILREELELPPIARARRSRDYLSYQKPFLDWSMFRAPDPDAALDAWAFGAMGTLLELWDKSVGKNKVPKAHARLIADPTAGDASRRAAGVSPGGMPNLREDEIAAWRGVSPALAPLRPAGEDLIVLRNPYDLDLRLCLLVLFNRAAKWSRGKDEAARAEHRARMDRVRELDALLAAEAPPEAWIEPACRLRVWVRAGFAQGHDPFARARLQELRHLHKLFENMVRVTSQIDDARQWLALERQRDFLFFDDRNQPFSPEEAQAYLSPAHVQVTQTAGAVLIHAVVRGAYGPRGLPGSEYISGEGLSPIQATEHYLDFCGHPGVAVSTLVKKIEPYFEALHRMLMMGE